MRNLLERSRTLDDPRDRLFCLKQLGGYLRREVGSEISDVVRSWEEPHTSVVASLMEYLDGDQRQRVLHKFLDKERGLRTRGLPAGCAVAGC